MSTPFCKRPFLPAVLCALAGLCAPACATEIDDASGDVEASDSVDVAELTLLEVDVGAARVSFVELEPGALVLLARHAPDAPSPLQDPAVRGLNVVEQYEYWAKQPAPEILRAAHQRAIELEREELAAGAELAPEVAEVLEAPEDEPIVDKILAADFEYWYCHQGNVQRCYIYVTGNRQHETFGKGMAGAVNPIYGNVKVQLRRRDASGWSNLPGGHVTVYQDEVLEYGAGIGSIIGRQFRATIYEAENDIYNWAHDWW